MVKHAKLCWGQDVYKLAEQCRDVAEVRFKVTGPITSSGLFQPTSDQKETEEYRTPANATKTEIKFVTYFESSSDN